MTKDNQSADQNQPIEATVVNEAKDEKATTETAPTQEATPASAPLPVSKAPTPPAQNANQSTSLGHIGVLGATFLVMIGIVFIYNFWASLGSLVEYLKAPTMNYGYHYLEQVERPVDHSDDIIYSVTMTILNAAIVATVIIVLRALALRKHQLIVGQAHLALYAFTLFIALSLLISSIHAGALFELAGTGITTFGIAAIAFASYLRKSEAIKRYANK